MSQNSVTVVSLAAWCDLAAAGERPETTSFCVREIAFLSDGREVTLLDDRGWGSSAPLDAVSADIESAVYTAVLPDDAEETGNDHEWQIFEDNLREAGIVITQEELKILPYRVILGEHLQSRLRELQGGAARE